MEYDDAKKIIYEIINRYAGDELMINANLTLLLSILSVKLKVWAPEEYENFKTIYLKKAFNLEI